MSRYVSLLNSYEASAITLNKKNEDGHDHLIFVRKCSVKVPNFKLASSNDDPERWTTLKYLTYNLCLLIDQ